MGVVKGTTRPQSYILTTRPPTSKIKVGSKGAPFNAYTNAFKIQKRPNWNLVQHRVDFKPDEDVTKMRKTLVKLGEKELKGEYLFDGTMLFATRRLDGTVINVKDPATGRIFETLPASRIEISKIFPVGSLLNLKCVCVGIERSSFGSKRI